MDVLSDDHEREQVVRAWWRENWKPIIFGVLLAIAGIVGYRQWQAYELKKSQELAYELYQEQALLQASGRDGAARAQTFIDAHQNLHGALLALTLASIEGEAGDFKAATTHVAFARAHGGALLENAAALAEARLLIEQKDLNGAGEILKALTAPAYRLEVLELQGDLALMRQDRAAARSAYLEALKLSMERRTPVSGILQLKYDSVTAPGDVPAQEMERPAASAAKVQP